MYIQTEHMSFPVGFKDILRKHHCVHYVSARHRKNKQTLRKYWCLGITIRKRREFNTVYIYICIRTFIYLFIGLFIYWFIYIFIYLFIFIYVFNYSFILYVYIYIYTCIYIYISYIYIYINWHQPLVINWLYAHHALYFGASITNCSSLNH